MRKILVLWTLMLFQGTVLSQTSAEFRRTEDVIYGRKFGTALTLDVFQPEKTNGAGVVLLFSGTYR